MKNIKAWIAGFFTLFIVDTILHVFVAGPYAAGQLEGVVRAPGTMVMPLIVVEIILITSVVSYLLGETGAVGKPLGYAFKIGAVVGGSIFAVYGLVNSAILPRWSTPVVFIDTIIGIIAAGLTAVVIAKLSKPAKKA